MPGIKVLVAAPSIKRQQNQVSGDETIENKSVPFDSLAADKSLQQVGGNGRKHYAGVNKFGDRKMSYSAMLVTSAAVSDEDLAEWALSVGCVRVPNESSRFVYSEGASDVWLSVQDATFFSTAYDQQTIDEWGGVLHGRPRAAIELDLDHSTRSRMMYLKIAYMLATKWDSILVDINDAVVPGSEIEQLYLDATTSEKRAE